jgi:hypothetical protein
MARGMSFTGDEAGEYGKIAEILANQANPSVYFAAFPPDHHRALLRVPLTSVSHQPIRYAVNYFGEEVPVSNFNCILYIYPPADAPAGLTTLFTGNYIGLYGTGKQD